MWRRSQAGSSRRLLAPAVAPVPTSRRLGQWALTTRTSPAGRHTCENWANVGGNGQNLADGDQVVPGRMAANVNMIACSMPACGANGPDRPVGDPH